MNPFDYGLCGQTVTLYRKDGEQMIRQVVEHAYLSEKRATPAESFGKSLEKKFQLIIPGDIPLEPGDRVFRGIGPLSVDWQQFVPALVDGLYECSFVKPCYWENEITHWEAGNRKETL